MRQLTSLRRLLCLGLVLAGALPAAAPASTAVLRPDADVVPSAAWSTDGPSAWSVLDDDVLQPAAPPADADRLTSTAEAATVELGLSDTELPAGAQVTRIRAWVHAATGSARTLTYQLRHGSTLIALAGALPDKPAGWQRFETTAALTQAQLDDLRLRVTLAGLGTSTATTVHAAYVEVETKLAPADVETPGLPSPVDPAAADLKPARTATPAAPKGASIVVEDRLRVDAAGRIPITVACPADSPANCKGRFAISVAAPTRPTCAARRKGRRARCARRAPRARAAAAPSRKAKTKPKALVVAEGTFDLAAGTQQTFSVTGRKGRLRVIRKQRRKCQVAVTTYSLGTPVTQVRTVTLLA